mmetsp:Transcript_30001/g.64262  ORF Transcript_30001/g.64262 Transcript_30001/m.64262 type:complete len:541 (-) Transcript_30001:2834-4456(-)
MSRRSQPNRGGKPSIAFHMIRHAESNNNKVYAKAKDLFRFGSSDFDLDGFSSYVDTHRRADPHLSPLGTLQAATLADDYLNPSLLEHRASSPVRILCSPMLRTLLTIRPTLERFILSTTSSRNDKGSPDSKKFQQKIHMTIVSFYHEIEGCHTKGKAEPGMNRKEIYDCLFQHLLDDEQLQIKGSDIDEIVTLDFVGFDQAKEDGWYVGYTGHELRIDAEARAAKYCLWLSDYLDGLMYSDEYNLDDGNNTANNDLFDVGCLLPGEDLENQHDNFSQRMRRRRTVLAVGHGDFMSVVLKRLVGGYVGCGKGGRLVEQSGLPHRTAFAHYNTGITELEYFGHSRFIVMTTNVTPHIPQERHRELRSGGTLRDGWAFTVTPVPDVTVGTEVVSNNGDDSNDCDRLHDHDREQKAALGALYLSSSSLDEEILRSGEKSTDSANDENSLRFVVKRGFQVLAVATYSGCNGLLTDVAIRPTGCVEYTLFDAIKSHARLQKQSEVALRVRPRALKNKKLFATMGFVEPEHAQNSDEAGLTIMTLAL